MDLIDRQAAIDEMRTRQHSANEWYATAKSKDDEKIMARADSAIASFIECVLTLKKLPSVDAVEVVRCKDCYHYDEEHSRCLLNDSDFKPTDYCSYGSK